MSDAEEQDVETPETAPEEEAAESGPSVSLERQGTYECTIRVEADADYLRERYQKELASLQSEVALPGFRKGRAPVGLVERRMGSSLRSDIVSSVLSEGYDKAVEENDLSVVAETDTPDLEKMTWQPGQPLEFQVRIEVLPEVEVAEEHYKGLKVEVPALEATDELLRDEMDRFAQQFATWEEVPGEIDLDDYVEAEVEVAEAGVKETMGFYPRAEHIGPFAVEGVKGMVVGAKAGDELELDGTPTEEEGEGPREDLADLAGKTLKLRLAIQRAMRRRVPDLDDELAKKVGLESAEEFEPLVRERLENSVRERKDEVTRQMVVQALVERVPCEMPPSLIEQADERERVRHLVRLLRAGVSRHLAQRTAESGNEQRRDAVERRLKAEFLLRKVAEKERIIVTESEVDSQIRAFASRQDWREERARSYMEGRGMVRAMRDEMREGKTIEFLLENASTTELSPDEFAKRHGQPEPEAEAPEGDE